jgi:hypothetical protein
MKISPVALHSRALAARKLLTATLATDLVLTGAQLDRRGLFGAAEALGLPSVTLSLRTLVTVPGSERQLQFVALDEAVLEHHSPEKLMELAILAEARATLSRSGAEFRRITSGRGGLMPDAVLINGPVGSGLDGAVECDSGYSEDKLLDKAEGFAHPPANQRVDSHLGFAESLWVVTSLVRARHLQELFKTVPPAICGAPHPRVVMSVQIW